MRTPTLRSRIWNILRTARTVGRTGVAVATLATVLQASPEVVLAAVLGDMTDTPAGSDAPRIYCDPSDPAGPVLSPRSFPE